jgi:YVTN family beta-propeller protein
MRVVSTIPIWLAASLVLVCLAIQSQADEATLKPLVLERSVPLPHTSGRIDHMAVDLKRARLFVAELGSNTVGVVDLVGGQVIHRIDGLKEPQGIGYSPRSDTVAVASAGDGSVRFYRGEDYAEAGRTDLGDDADNVRLDPASGNFLVGYGNGGIATLDDSTGTIIGKAALPAHPEGFRVGAGGRRALVNIPDAGQIAVIDLTTGKQTAAWRVPNLHANFPMAWDEDNRLLAVVFRSPPRLVLLDSDTGAVKETRETCGDADDVFFDSRRARIYVSCGAGHVDIFGAERGSGTHRLLSRVDTKSGARTSLFVPELDRLFVAQRAGLLGSDAAVLVFRPSW